MKLFPDPEETIEGVGRAIRAGQRSCVDVLESCLAKIDEWEKDVHAWVVVDREGARARAKQLDAEIKAGRCRSPLHGIPIGIKDIIDVAGLPTAAGFAPWHDRVASDDADIVASLRTAGAVILGKTVTTQFAWIDPSVTRNPWNLDRTPGGSSSGSAAAVACGMCLGALGTQTGGSIIRPASFCGVAGYKPYRWLSMHNPGIREFAPSLDYWGPIAHTIRDLMLIHYYCQSWQWGYPVDSRYASDEAAPLALMEAVIADYFGDPRRPYAPPASGFVGGDPWRPFAPPAFGVLEGFFERRSDPEMWQAFRLATDALAAAGATVTTLREAEDFEEVLRRHRVIMAAEAAAGHSDRFRESPELYAPKLRELIHEGSAIFAADYLQARAHQRKFNGSIMAGSGEFDGYLLTPATVGAAPSPETTGDPSFNSPWSYTGSCVVSFPMALSAEGLPLAIQIVGQGYNEEMFRIAQWCEDVIRRQFQSRQERP